MEADAARELEVRRRRSLSEAPHPDECPKLTLHGAPFAVPPRRARVVPVFGADGLSIETHDGTDWPQSRRLVELVEVRQRDHCPECGRPRHVSVAVSVQSNAEFLTAAFSLASRLLDRQYTLTAQQKSRLLAFDADRLPAWIPELLEWCS